MRKDCVLELIGNSKRNTGDSVKVSSGFHHVINLIFI